MHTKIGPVAGFSWYLVIVNSRSEKKVAALLQRHGLEVFLPVERMKRRWSDRVKWVEFLLFAASLFCRCEAKDYLKLIHCPGVCRNPIPVPDEEMDCLKKVMATPYAKEACDIPAGSYPTVNLMIDQSIPARLVAPGAESHVIVPLESVGQAVTLRVPSEDIIRPGPARPDVIGQSVQNELK